jgi:hypothetical protein
MQNKFLTFLLSTAIFLLSCSKDDNSQNVDKNLYEKYKLKTETISNLSALSIGFGIFEIGIKESSTTAYEVTTKEYNDKKQVDQKKYLLKMEGNQLIISIDDKKLIIDKGLNKSFYSSGIKYDEITESFLNQVSKEENLSFKRLIFLFAELYDKNIMKVGTNSTARLSSSRTCLKFESGVGLTSTASKLRADNDTNGYIKDGHGDCKVVGSDTSCLTDAHVCITTVTMSCSSSCNWWN